MMLMAMAKSVTGALYRHFLLVTSGRHCELGNSTSWGASTTRGETLREQRGPTIKRMMVTPSCLMAGGLFACVTFSWLYILHSRLQFIPRNTVSTSQPDFQDAASSVDLGCLDSLDVRVSISSVISSRWESHDVSEARGSNEKKMTS